MYTAQELKKKYLDFFESKGHAVIPSASLIPQNDPTVLFTAAGMHPLVPYLLGEKHPAGRRLCNVQKCLRTGDIDEVGDDVHLTFFEMLGNWSLGDYWKEEAIAWSFEFLTEVLQIPLEKLAISCFAGEPENNIPKDEESAEVWQALGLPKERIAFLGRADNWWGPAGQTGPCGPDTEMYYWTGQEPAPKVFDVKDKNWLEIWNDVFMQYNKTADGKYEELKQKNVDTGLGVERTVAALNGQNNVFAVDTFLPIIAKIKESAKTEETKAIRIIADHLRAATFILAEGIEPSNMERGYVLRRLIRRSVRYGRQLGMAGVFCHQIAAIVIKEMNVDYPELKKNKDFIIEQLVREEEKFLKTLEKGLKEFEKISAKNISGYDAFLLFTSYGFPLEITKELAAERGIKVDEKGFEAEFKNHQELSRAGAEQKFKGGLADNSEISARAHTAAHLMLAALRQVLGDQVFQKGSNITPERIRFDFSYGEKMTLEQIKKVEDLVNEQIQKGIPVVCEEMPLEEAKKQGAMGVFEHKYGDKVKVYTVGDFSSEICGGPHAKNTGDLRHFRILKEESSSAGVRRIKATIA